MRRAIAGGVLADLRPEETYALTNLRGSPYRVEPVLDQALVDLANVEVTLESFTDRNSGIMYLGLENRTLQAGILHRFRLDFADAFGNRLSGSVVLDPAYKVELRNAAGVLISANQSYYDGTLETNLFDLYTENATTTIPGDYATMTVTSQGTPVGKSPFE